MHAVRQALPGRRWHFQHGPIDIVIGADGEQAAVRAAHEAAWQRFQPLLAELVDELPLLRRAVSPELPCPLQGAVARRMWQACARLAALEGCFITPMAAVAGAVAEELIGSYRREGVERAYVNNGGDAALHLAPGQTLRVGLFADLARFDEQGARSALAGALALDGQIDIPARMPIRGLATSGWRGRSFSLGIADAVTVFAPDAAAADAAATIVANAVNVEHAAIERCPANRLKDDSDLGAIPVTVAVPVLPSGLVQSALRAGAQRAQALQRCGLLHCAVLCCQGQVHVVGDLAPPAALGGMGSARGGGLNAAPSARVRAPGGEIPAPVLVR
jgi:ApbE superfamily uncharacterized protein (UPF0280 family)